MAKAAPSSSSKSNKKKESQSTTTTATAKVKTQSTLSAFAFKASSQSEHDQTEHDQTEQQEHSCCSDHQSIPKETNFPGTKTIIYPEQSTESTEHQAKMRSILNAKWVGAHVSAANGLYHAVTNSVAINGNAAAMFLKNQRTFSFKPLESSVVSDFQKACHQHGFDASKHFLPHGSYLINLGNPDEEKRAKSFAIFMDDLQRCEQLGIGLYNFHPGSTVGQCSTQQSIELISDCLIKAIQGTQSVCIVLENMAGQGNVIGSRFEELAAIIQRTEQKEPKSIGRLGVCLDTCHLFAAGYDIRSQSAYQRVMADFDRIIGFDRLRGIHLNDSKEGLASCKDRHESIGKGKIGLDAFRWLMNDGRISGIPMVLETPDEELYAKEIALLYSLMDTNIASAISTGSNELKSSKVLTS